MICIYEREAFCYTNTGAAPTKMFWAGQLTNGEYHDLQCFVHYVAEYEGLMTSNPRFLPNYFEVAFLVIGIQFWAQCMCCECTLHSTIMSFNEDFPKMHAKNFL